MIEKAVSARVGSHPRRVRGGHRVGLTTCFGRTCSCTTCCRCRELDTVDLRPTTIPDAQSVSVEAARQAFRAKLENLDAIRDEAGQGYGDRLLSLVMLNVLDEKWKDHLYDLDQLRNAIHYRSWGQKDPLVEYKQEAYTMFVDLMNDIYNTFSDRFLKVQLQFGPPPGRDDFADSGNGGKPRGDEADPGSRPRNSMRSAFSRTSSKTFPRVKARRSTSRPTSRRRPASRPARTPSSSAPAGRRPSVRPRRRTRTGPASDATTRARAVPARSSRSVTVRACEPGGNRFVPRQESFRVILSQAKSRRWLGMTR